MSGGSSACGAYGLALTGVASDGWLVPAAAWPSLEVLREVGNDEPPPVAIGERASTFHLMGGGRVEVEREPRQARYITPQPLPDDEVLHPHLAIAAAMVSHWLGRTPFHAGGIVGRDGAWLVAGVSGAGKSSLLAGVAAAGRDIVSDDLFVCDGRRCYAGPRAVDLLDESAAALELAGPSVSARAATRRRLSLPPLVPELPVAGWIDLEWADRLDVTELPPAERLRRLSRRRTFPQLLPAHDTLLELVELPAYVLRRARSWSEFGESVELAAQLAT